MHRQFEYCDLLGCNRLVSPSVEDFDRSQYRNETIRTMSDVVAGLKSLGNYRTCNPTFLQELELGQDTLKAYFEGERTTKRPLNCLLLGPPGSGKTFLAKKLGGTLQDSMFMEFNLSQTDHPGRLAEIFREIGQIGRRIDAPKIVFLDEFDVTIGGTSIIRYLIHSMYEGKFGDGQELKKTAFIFSGSYLKNKQLLSILQRSASDFDFLRFLHDTYVHLTDRELDRRQVRDFFDLSLRYREAKNQMSPDRDALDYLRRLDKLVDFLSRINGFVIEIPDVSAPLEITSPPFWISQKECVGNLNLPKRLQIKRGQGRSVAKDVLNFVLAMEAKLREEKQTREQTNFPAGAHIFKEYLDSPYQPILSFKNMLLTERLSRIIMMLEDKFASPSCRNVQITRRLLNYITVVPLIHGMRSLEYFIGQLSISMEEKDPRIYLDHSQLNEDILRMHLRVEGDYRDEWSVWAAIRNANRVAFDPHKQRSLQEEYIKISFR